MADDAPKVMSWPMIIAIMVVAGLVLGFTSGTICTVLGISGSVATTATGVSMGLVGALLVTRRNAALAAAKK